MSVTLCVLAQLWQTGVFVRLCQYGVVASQKTQCSSKVSSPQPHFLSSSVSSCTTVIVIAHSPYGIYTVLCVSPILHSYELIRTSCMSTLQNVSHFWLAQVHNHGRNLLFRICYYQCEYNKGLHPTGFFYLRSTQSLLQYSLFAFI